MKSWYTYQITEFRKDGSYEVFYYEESPKFQNRKVVISELRKMCERFEKSKDCKVCFGDVLQWDESGYQDCALQFVF